MMNRIIWRSGPFVYQLFSHNHLRNSLPTQRLAVHKCLPSHTSQQVAPRSDEQKYRSSDQTRGSRNQAEPLDERHYSVDRSAHVVGLEATDEAIEVCGCWADSEEEWDLDEEDYEGGDAVGEESAWYWW